jgi:hypothetical protein
MGNFQNITSSREIKINTSELYQNIVSTHKIRVKMSGKIYVVSNLDTMSWPQVIEHSWNFIKKLRERPEYVDISDKMKVFFSFFFLIIGFLSLCISFLSQMGPSDSQVGKAAMRAAWRCTTGDSGGLSVMMDGLSWIHTWLVDS